MKPQQSITEIEAAKEWFSEKYPRTYAQEDAFERHGLVWELSPVGDVVGFDERVIHIYRKEVIETWKYEYFKDGTWMGRTHSELFEIYRREALQPEQTISELNVDEGVVSFYGERVTFEDKDIRDDIELNAKFMGNGVLTLPEKYSLRKTPALGGGFVYKVVHSASPKPDMSENKVWVHKFCDACNTANDVSENNCVRCNAEFNIETLDALSVTEGIDPVQIQLAQSHFVGWHFGNTSTIRDLIASMGLTKEEWLYIKSDGLTENYLRESEIEEIDKLFNTNTQEK